MGFLTRNLPPAQIPTNPVLTPVVPPAPNSPPPVARGAVPPPGTAQKASETIAVVGVPKVEVITRPDRTQAETQVLRVVTEDNVTHIFYSEPGFSLPNPQSLLGKNVHQSGLGIYQGADTEAKPNPIVGDINRAGVFGNGAVPTSTPFVYSLPSTGQLVYFHHKPDGTMILDNNGEPMFTPIGPIKTEAGASTSAEALQIEQAALARAQTLNVLLGSIPKDLTSIAFEAAKTDLTATQIEALMQTIEQAKYAPGLAGIEARLGMWKYLLDKGVIGEDVYRNAVDAEIYDTSGLAGVDKSRAAQEQQAMLAADTERERGRLSANTLINDELSQNQEARASAVAQGTNTENFTGFVDKTAKAAIPAGPGGAYVAAMAPVYNTQSQMLAAANQRTPGAEAGRGFLMQGMQNAPPYDPYRPIFTMGPGGGSSQPFMGQVQQGPPQTPQGQGQGFLGPPPQGQNQNLSPTEAALVAASQDPSPVPPEVQEQLDNATTAEEFAQIYTAAQLGAQPMTFAGAQ